jgi:hypothetical protein
MIKEFLTLLPNAMVRVPTNHISGVLNSYAVKRYFLGRAVVVLLGGGCVAHFRVQFSIGDSYSLSKKAINKQVAF